MSRRWAWWTAGGLLLVVLLAFGAWRISREIPDRLRKAEEAIREEAARYGLRVSYRNLRFHILYPRVTLEDLAVVDERPGIELLRAESVDVSLSPGRLISGDSPVSRIRLRKFTLHAEEANRPAIDRMRSGKRTGPIPEILLLEGKVRIGPFGPLKSWEARVPELRLRDVKFLGTRISLQAEEASGEIALTGADTWKWPFASIDADLFDQEGVVRIRKFRASGPSAAVKISGVVEPARKSGDVKLSGDVDLARWISAGAPYSRLIGGFAEKGAVDFSASLSGSLEDPAGSATLTLKNGRFRWNTSAEMELAAAVSKRKIRIDSLKGKLWGGTLSGSGSYDMDSGQGEGRLSLARANFGTVPWKEWGFAWRPAGAGDAEIALTGNLRKRVRAAFSWKNPSGLELADGGKSPGVNLRLPLAAAATGDYFPDGRIAITALQLRAGESTLSGAGDVILREKSFRMAGEFSVPRGKASDYGWDAPLSWASLTGSWEAGGPASRPRVSVRMEAQSLSARALPAVPLVVKLEGDPADVFHFVADVPAPLANVTATGTFTGPLSPEPLTVEAAVAVRDIDFSEGNRWVAAALGSPGAKHEDAARYLAGMTGTGTGDLRISISGEDYSLTGSLHSPGLRLKGVEVRKVSVEGGWSRSGSVDAWKATVDGETGGGALRVAGEGKNGSAEISGTIDRLDLGQAASLFSRGKELRIKGTAGIRFAARHGEGGWELGRLHASAPRVSIDNAVLEGVSAEGSLGAVSGRFLLSAQSPEMKTTAEVHRGGDWPVSFAFAAIAVPTDFLLSAAGRTGLAAGGRWSADAEGTVSAADLLSGKGFPPDAVTALRFSVSAEAPSVSGIAFEELRASGKKNGDAVAGEVWSRGPDTRLAFSVSMREPFGFRVEGPFSFGTSVNGKGKEEGKARFALSGKAEVGGSLRALSNTSGSLDIRQFTYRDGGFDISGKDISAKMSTEGIRWTGGTLTSAGNSLNVSGKVSWNGDLDVRLEGRLPAAAIRLVTDVFERLDGTMRLELRFTGKWDNPSLVGTGRLDGGVFSFRGYAQLFEEMRAEATLSREKLIFEHFEGRSGGGYIDGRGELPLRFDAHQRLFFSVDFFDMRFPYPDDFRPVLQGHVELLGPYDDFLVTGDVEVQSAQYTRTLRPERVLVDFRKRLADVTARREASEFRVRLDVNAIADGTIRIKNNLADMYAKGEFKVAGDVSRVIILGAFDVTEGTVEYQGNRYDLKRVSVEFQDPRRNNPRLDARAETKKGNVTVTVSVTGTLDKYEVDLASDPPLSKNDIVSLLSLGVTSQALAGSEGAVGAGVASSLVLGPYKGRFEEGVKGIVRLDKFAIEPAFSASTKSFEPKFIVGKSFGDRFSVSVSTSVGTTAESSATAEYKLLENVFLSGAWESATTTSEGDLGADVKIRYRYRQFRDFLGARD
jgi:autotransporter translocation and assembly factor TamB